MIARQTSFCRELPEAVSSESDGCSPPLSASPNLPTLTGLTMDFSF